MTLPVLGSFDLFTVFFVAVLLPGSKSVIDDFCVNEFFAFFLGFDIWWKSHLLECIGQNTLFFGRVDMFEFLDCSEHLEESIYLTTSSLRWYPTIELINEM